MSVFGIQEPARVTTSLADDGYVALRGLITGKEVESITRAVDRLLDGPVPEVCERPNNTLVPLRWSDPVVFDLLAGEHRRQRIETAIGARDLRWISGYISVKDAFSPPLWWHQDWWCWNHSISFAPNAAQVAVACYLTKTTADNGALRLLPGSHLRRHPVHAVLPEAHSGDAALLEPAHPAMRDQPDQVTAGLRAGDAVAMDYRLLHGTQANHAGQRRDCILLNFAPSWADLPAEIRSHLISHPALPGPDEPSPRSRPAHHWLPTYSGARHDLELSRHPPAEFSR